MDRLQECCPLGTVHHIENCIDLSIGVFDMVSLKTQWMKESRHDAPFIVQQLEKEVTCWFKGIHWFRNPDSHG